MKSIEKDHAYGAILGALAGDAAGATLEFLGRRPEPDEVRQAMEMTGGGVWGTAPGQITDDGEMALSLMHALAGQTDFSIEGAAAAYFRWYRSGPFDIGNTTSNAMGGGLSKPEGQVYEGMLEASERANMGSKANGALMRIAPLGVWGHRVSPQKLMKAAMADAKLTHPNQTCRQASALYSLAIRHLMHRPQDGRGAFDLARKVARKTANEEVRGWLEDARAGRDPGYYPQAGFVKYGFTHAFRHLNQGTPYAEAIRETLAGGGDTDTNACIVGGMIGALHGARAIPEAMEEALLSCDTSKGNDRPEFLQTRLQLPELIDRLIE
ncbi:MAG: ADP-ribosylglycohydrolase family protein [Spirochaetales bacterium]|nr:ADP-ribosylglycohydrolase family protein [Spirochaetales bacterium]MCF7938976.1 ADP-ribosylglycohydrolase family protein [Spirochaetales bacterium]